MISVWHQSTARAIREQMILCFRMALTVLWYHTLTIRYSAALSWTRLFWYDYLVLKTFLQSMLKTVVLLKILHVCFMFCRSNFQCLRTPSPSAPEPSYALCSPQQLLPSRWMTRTLHLHNVYFRNWQDVDTEFTFVLRKKSKSKISRAKSTVLNLTVFLSDSGVVVKHV